MTLSNVSQDDGRLCCYEEQKRALAPLKYLTQLSLTLPGFSYPTTARRPKFGRLIDWQRFYLDACLTSKRQMIPNRITTPIISQIRRPLGPRIRSCNSPPRPVPAIPCCMTRSRNSSFEFSWTATNIWKSGNFQFHASRTRRTASRSLVFYKWLVKRNISKGSRRRIEWRVKTEVLPPESLKMAIP